MFRPDPRHAQAAARGRDAAHPVGQARRRVQDAQGRAARAARELADRSALGGLGPLPRVRAHGPDDVRPDDRRQLDLHRHARHRPGHVRDIRRVRQAALRRNARRQARRHRRLRRHGRSAAPGRNDGRGLLSHRRRRSNEARETRSRRATWTRSPRTSRPRCDTRPGEPQHLHRHRVQRRRPPAGDESARDDPGRADRPDECARPAQRLRARRSRPTPPRCNCARTTRTNTRAARSRRWSSMCSSTTS